MSSAVPDVFALLGVVLGSLPSPPVGDQKATIGSPAPEFGLENILQAPPGTITSWESLKGKVVVLDFWATWCVPCLKEIPALNELSRKFGHRPVEFISITDEPEAKVRPFLEKRPMGGWVGLDTDGSMFADYGITGRPVTVVVDADGVIAAVTNVSALTEEALHDVLAGNPARRFAGDAGPPMLQITIRPLTYKPRLNWFTRGLRRVTMPSGPQRCTLSELTVLDAVSAATGWPPENIVWPASLSTEQAYSIDYFGPDPESFWTGHDLLAGDVIAQAFDLQWHTETRDTEVFVLTKADAYTPKICPVGALAKWLTESSSEAWDTGVEASVSEIRTVLPYMASFLGRPVVDETGLEGLYSFKLEWDPDDPASLFSAVKEKLGLELRPARRPVRMLVVEAKQRWPRPWCPPLPRATEPTSPHRRSLPASTEVRAETGDEAPGG